MHLCQVLAFDFIYFHHKLQRLGLQIIQIILDEIILNWVLYRDEDGLHFANVRRGITFVAHDLLVRGYVCFGKFVLMILLIINFL